MKRALLVSMALLLVAACTSGSTNDGSLAICRNLPTDSACSVNLTFLSCTYLDDAEDEVTELCVSDNVNQCPDGNGLGGCTNECNSGEYGAVCAGSAADGAAQSIAPPSSNCRALDVGQNAYCCPCGS